MKYLFLDESGSHDLAVIDPAYPVFVLGGAIIDGESTLEAIGEALAGLELADLIVTPVGRAALGRTSFVDHRVVESKLRRDKNGRVEGVGLVMLPKEEGRVPPRSSRPQEPV